VGDVSEEFQAEVVRESSCTTLVVSGELDLATCEQLETCLADASRDHDGDVVVDLAGVRFLDSCALRVLIAAHARLADRDQRLVLHRPSEVVTRVLTVAGLLTLFAMDGSGD
jgi:anti-sigma B factor antagonist